MKKKLLIMTIIAMIILTIGITYAIFIQRLIGQEKAIAIAGDIWMKYETGEKVNINMMPRATYDENNYYEFQISGKNTYEKKDIYYEIILKHGEEIESKTERIKDEFIKIRLVEIENGEEKELINNRSYKDLSDKRIYVNVISKGTKEEINKTYRLYAWISDEVLIGNIEKADYDTDTWSKIYASLKVEVKGDLYEKYVPNSQLAHINTTYGQFWPSEIESIKTSISEINFINVNSEEMNNIKNTNTYLDESLLNNKIYDLEQTNTIGFVKSFLVEDTSNSGTYKMYIASEDDTLYFPKDSSYMFNGFTNIKNINNQKIIIDTSLVTDMRHMFDNCNNLESIDVSSFDTANVTAMHYMFYNCNKLTELDLSNFDTGQVTRMDYMFAFCKELKKLDVSSFNTSKVTRMEYMFHSCNSLKTLDVSNFDTTKVTTMDSMFNNCNSLKTLDVSNFDTGQVTNMQYMFGSCSNLISLDIGDFNTENVLSMSYMFYNCKSLTNLDVSSFDTGKVTNMSYMFDYCESLTSLDLNSFDTENVTDMSGMFINCYNLVNLNVSNFDTSSVIYMNRMFYYAKSLKELNITNFITSQVTTMERMFDGLYEIIELDLSSFDTTKVTNMDVMFANMFKLEKIYVSEKWTIANVTTSERMFENDSKLVGGNETKWNSNYLDKTYARIDTEQAPGYFTYKEYVNN